MQPSKILETKWIGAAALCLSLTSAPAADIFKADVADNLNLATSWSNSVAPSSSDFAAWDVTVQVNTNSVLGGNVSWGGIKILDPASTIIINTNSSGNIVTLGASGIDLSAATHNLTMNNGVLLGASQTWNVGSGLTLTAVNGLDGSSTTILTKTGNGTLIFNSTVNGVFAGNLSMNAGLFQINSANGNNNSAVGTGIITNNGATLRCSSGHIIGNVLVWNGNCTLDDNNTSTALDGAWQGAGTVLITDLNSSSLTLTAGGNGNGGGSMANFTGTIIIADTNSAGTAAAGNFRFNNGGSSPNVGNAAMTLNLGGPNSAVHLTEKNSGTTTHFGALIGGPNTQLATSENYVIGEANLDTTFAGTILSTSTLNKSGNGVLTLTGNNPNTGTTTVSGGILQIGDGATTSAGALGTGSIVVNANSTLCYNKPDDFTVNNAISGAGTLIKTNADNLAYNGTNSSSGTTIISQGKISLGSTGWFLAPIYLASGAILDVTGNSTFVLSSTLAGSGTVAGTLTAAGGTIVPGGNGAAGTLYFANGLTESGNVSHQFEFSTPGGTNDLISITGDLTLSNTNTIIASHFGGGTVPPGTYTLFTYSGNFNGTLNNLALSGAAGVFTNPPNQIQVIIATPPRLATNLTWVGDGVANSWDNTSTNDWKNGATLFTFQSGDSVTFDSTATNNTVSVTTTVLPAAVVVNAANDYTLTGNGSIGGSTGLTKTNTGRLILATTNSYTGPTVIGGGVLQTANLNNGNGSSSIGASTSAATNLVVYGGAGLSYAGTSVAMDRNITLNGSGAMIEVTNPAGSSTLTLNGSIVGTGPLVKSGAGSLALNAASGYSGGTVISNGFIVLGSNAANDSGANNGLGSTNGAVTFAGGTLQLFGYSGSTGNNFNTFRTPLVVPAGQTGTLQMFPRGPDNTSGLVSSLTGGGTLNLVVNYVRDSLDGDWSAFTGLINVTPKGSAAAEFRINNNFGYSNAAIYLNDNVIMDRAGTTNSTINLGELGSSGAAIVGQGNGSAVNPTWCVGWKNTSATFNGFIEDDGITSVIKVAPAPGP